MDMIIGHSAGKSKKDPSRREQQQVNREIARERQRRILHYQQQVEKEEPLSWDTNMDTETAQSAGE